MTLALEDALQAFAPALPLGVALSGGADSTALLTWCARRWPGQVRALHVNHGLQAAAADFERHCVALCQQLDVPLSVAAVDAFPRPGQSPEDAARSARYAALLDLAQRQDGAPALASIALAQHADDQAETVLLALGRGAGLAGLAAMPAHWQRAGLHFYRPLLRVAGADLRRWLQLQHISFVSDPSNADLAFTRNRIRARLLPALDACFPAFRDTLARSAAHAAQAQELLDALGADDLALCAPGPQDAPAIAALRGLGSARLANVLRYWLKVRHQAIPSTAQMQALVSQVQACRTRGHRIHIKVAGGFVQRQGDGLAWYNAQRF